MGKNVKKYFIINKEFNEALPTQGEGGLIKFLLDGLIL